MSFVNRADRRRLQKQQKKAAKGRTWVMTEEQLENLMMTPQAQEILDRKVSERILEIDANYTLDLDTMVIWTLRQYGWGEKRLKRFYIDMFKQHRRLRAYYQTNDPYPERALMKREGIDVEAWYNEIFDENGNYRQGLEEFLSGL